MTKILIIGAKGYLGSFLSNNLKNYFSIDTLDTRKEKISNKYDFIINCAALCSLEECEKYPKKSYISNYLPIRILFDNKIKSNIINFSSYYVYDNDCGLCNEFCNVTLDYYYCFHKVLSEDLVTRMDGVSFRIGKLFGGSNDKKNKLFNYIVNNKDIILDKVKFNPTSAQQVFDAVLYQIKNKNLKGVYNLSNEDIATHVEFGKEIIDKMNLNCNIIVRDKINKDFHNYGKFVMDTSKISQHIKLRKWKDDLNEFIKRRRSSR